MTSADKIRSIRSMLEDMEDGNTNGFLGVADLIEHQLRKMEKVCVFIDNSNLFWALRSMLDNKRLDYVKLKTILAQDRQADVRFYYSEPQNPVDYEAKQKLIKQRGFYEFLEKAAEYKMIKLPLWERVITNKTSCDHCGKDSHEAQQVSVEKGLDCEIVYDMCRLALTARYDRFILVAGDQDYARTVKRIKEETGIKVDVAFFDGTRVSPILAKEANQFIDLNKFKNELFAYNVGKPEPEPELIAS